MPNQIRSSKRWRASVVAFLALCWTASVAWTQDTNKIEIVPQIPHAAGICCAAISGAGTHVASGDYEGTIKLWDITTGRLIRTIAGHAKSIWSIAFSSDDRRLLSASGDGTAKLWDATTGQLMRTFEGHTEVAPLVRTVFPLR